MPLVKQQELRYGENGHQKAALYVTADKKGAFAGMTQLQGKELSYNNIRDLDVAWKGVCAFDSFVKNASPVAGTDYSQFDGIITGKDANGNPATPSGTPINTTFGDAASSVFTIALKHNTPCGAA